MYDVWKNALAEIEQQISPANFSTWFQGTSIISNEDGHIVIGVKNSFFVKQLRNRYLNIITTALENNNLIVKEIDFEVQTKIKSKIRPREITTDTIALKKQLKNLKKQSITKELDKLLKSFKIETNKKVLKEELNNCYYHFLLFGY